MSVDKFLISRLKARQIAVFLVTLQNKIQRNMASQKIVYLHLKEASVGDSHFFFGSIKAIFDNIDEERIGIKYKSLTNALRGRDFYENRRCTIRVGVLITKQQRKKAE